MLSSRNAAGQPSLTMRGPTEALCSSLSSFHDAVEIPTSVRSVFGASGAQAARRTSTLRLRLDGPARLQETLRERAALPQSSQRDFWSAQPRFA